MEIEVTLSGNHSNGHGGELGDVYYSLSTFIYYVYIPDHNDWLKIDKTTDLFDLIAKWFDVPSQLQRITITAKRGAYYFEPIRYFEPSNRKDYNPEDYASVESFGMF
jgi:hypothetical protein